MNGRKHGTSLFLLALGALAALGATACGGAEEPHAADPVGAVSEPLMIGGGGLSGGSLGYTCDSSTCTCTGDEDCNDMFNGGVCGSTATCQIDSYGVTRCSCTKTATLSGAGVTKYTTSIGSFSAF